MPSTKGLHAGGAFSAVIPLVTLFYGGFIRADVEDPTRMGRDMFVLSKGHAIAALASIYAELGYFDAVAAQELAILREHFEWPSRAGSARASISPPVPWGKASPWHKASRSPAGRAPRFDSYALLGDGELQEGPIWEAVMYSGAEAPGQSVHPGGSQSWPARYLQPHGLSHAEAGTMSSRRSAGRFTASTPRIRWCLRRAGGFPPQPAQRQAHRHRLPLHQRATAHFPIS